MNLRSLQLVPMSYDEMEKFAGKYGANIIINHAEQGMILARVNNKEGKLVAMTDSLFGPKEIVLNKQDANYDLYWIGLR